MTPIVFAAGLVIGAIIGMAARPVADFIYTEFSAQIADARAVRDVRLRLEECEQVCPPLNDWTPIDLTDDHDEPKAAGRKR